MDTLPFYRSLIQELLLIIRGSRTQGQVDRLLGYRSKRVYGWESGRKNISWKDFNRYLKVCKINLEEIMHEFFEIPANIKIENANEVFKCFVGNQTLVELEKKLGLSKYRIGRILRLEAAPDAIEIFQVIYRNSPSFYAFMNKITSGRDIPIVAQEMQRHRSLTNLFFQYPEVSLVINAIYLPEYQKSGMHSNEWIAKKTKVHLLTVQKILKEMLSLNLIRKQGDHFKLNATEDFSPRGSREERLKGVLYWHQLTVDAITQGYEKSGCRTGWSVFNLSDPAYEELCEEWLKFRRVMVSIIQEDGKKNQYEKRLYAFAMALVESDYFKDSV